MKCGRPSIRDSRIVNGSDAVHGEYPWIANIMYKGRPFCGGWDNINLLF